MGMCKGQKELQTTLKAYTVTRYASNLRNPV